MNQEITSLPEDVELGERAYRALKEAEIEEHYHPEAITAEESDAQIREIFRQWDLDYA